MAVDYTTRDGIAVITLNNPPVNGLGYSTRLGIVDGIERAQADTAISAIVIIGAGKAFSGGADITEFNTPKATQEPTLHTVIKVVEGSSKPVIAAIHSVAMGGGLELALGAHYRVAAPGAQIALPEVKLGLLPGAGGTQRLPRAVGLETALNMIVSGAPVLSEKLGASGLFDLVTESDLLDAAVTFARKAAARGGPHPKVRDRKIEHPNAEGFIQFARNGVAGVAKNFPAPHKCIDAVEAGVKQGFDKGLAFERECFVALVQTPESHALRHAFFGERAASKIPDVPADTPHAQDRARRRDRCRDDGRRYRDELHQRGFASHAARDEAGSARSWPCHHPQELRKRREEGAFDAGKTRRAPRADQAHAFLR